jgi:hypothetical protein
MLAKPSSIRISHVVNDVYLENPYRKFFLDAMRVGDTYSNDSVSNHVQ